MMFFICIGIGIGIGIGEVASVRPCHMAGSRYTTARWMRCSGNRLSEISDKRRESFSTGGTRETTPELCQSLPPVL
jgi:hypothetical protein